MSQLSNQNQGLIQLVPEVAPLKLFNQQQALIAVMELGIITRALNC